MKKLIAGILSCCLFVNFAIAQSKVFKEVGEGMSTQTKVIAQDGQLVGYLFLTQLEKASSDSFNYQIDIVDENLNALGTVKFSDEQIHLQSVAFDQDVLCLAYLKSNIIGTEFKTRRSYKKSLRKAKNAVITQFINMDGKILKTNSVNVDIDLARDAFANQYYGNTVLVFTKLVGYGNLKHRIQVQNVSGKGFALFYGDDAANHLITYDLEGKQLWDKSIADAQGYALHTAQDNIYVLKKSEHKMQEGGYSLISYNFSGREYQSYALEDSKGNQLKVLTFANDPQTGKPFLTGNIINPSRGNKRKNIKQLSKGPYNGVFTININGVNKEDINQVCSYWSDGKSQPAISKKGYFKENATYSAFSHSFKDHQGNTYFAGPAYPKKVRWGTITSSVILLPTVFMSPYILYAFGTQKTRMQETMLLRQDKEGKIHIENAVPGNKSMYYPARVPLSYFNNRDYYHVVNNNTKSNYIVIEDAKDFKIYNVEQKKVARVIPNQKGDLTVSILPAKEGHVMVSEYNAKEKTRRLSIEAL